ncbi:MAG: class I SAM-dependent methyltransferase [bacterium]|nr:class I SAM-dependent methyltransferase [bacterium]
MFFKRYGKITNMPQIKAWEKEYQNPQLLTKKEEPQNDLKRFFKFLRKTEKIIPAGLVVLDLGSGTGRNINYLAQLGSKVTGLEISQTALDLAKERAFAIGVEVDYRLFDIGSVYPFENEQFDLVLDVMSSNSLNEKEREIYLREVFRVLKSGGFFFVKALCKDGDKNAKNLLKISPGKEKDTYLNRDMGLTERVFTQDDFIKIYAQYFKVIQLTKKTNYAQFKGQSYKRNYLISYFKKP